MATLTTCRACRRLLGNRATMCQNCGQPNSRRVTSAQVVLVALVAVFLVGLVLHVGG